MAEETNHPREVVEVALARVVQNKVEAAYRRTDLFERRRRLMEEPADNLVLASDYLFLVSDELILNPGLANKIDRTRPNPDLFTAQGTR